MTGASGARFEAAARQREARRSRELPAGGRRCLRAVHGRRPGGRDRAYGAPGGDSGGASHVLHRGRGDAAARRWCRSPCWATCARSTAAGEARRGWAASGSSGWRRRVWRGRRRAGAAASPPARWSWRAWPSWSWPSRDLSAVVSCPAWRASSSSRSTCRAAWPPRCGADPDGGREGRRVCVRRIGSRGRRRWASWRSATAACPCRSRRGPGRGPGGHRAADPERGTSLAQGIVAALDAIVAAEATVLTGYYTNRSPAPEAAPAPVGARQP